MIQRSTLLHLRIPFSFFLLPVFLFSLSLSPNPSLWTTIAVFICLHVFLYPASNGYNSYFDRDDGSIGGLKNPPPVDRSLYNTALAFDLVALLLALYIGWFFLLMILAYGLASKAYSHPSIRLKKFPVLGWLITGFFQGFVIFIASYYGINQCPVQDLLEVSIIFPAVLCSVLLWGSYPMTQIYQHKEDRTRGDITLSLKLGILGTFHFTAVAFTLAVSGFVYFYLLYFSTGYALVFIVLLLPVLIFFGYWYINVRKDLRLADFDHTMRLNLISSCMMNVIFSIFFLYDF